MAQAFFRHPIIYSLYSGDWLSPGAAKRTTLESGGNLPSYVSGRSFAMALLDIVARGAQPHHGRSECQSDLAPVTLASLRRNVASLDKSPLISHAAHGHRPRPRARSSASGRTCTPGSTTALSRVSGWYKRLDPEDLVRDCLGGRGRPEHQYSHHRAVSVTANDVARADLVAAAEQAADDGSPTRDAALGQLLKLELPIGWNRELRRSRSEALAAPRCASAALPHRVLERHRRHSFRTPDHGVRSHARRTLLVRCAEPSDRHSLDVQAQGHQRLGPRPSRRRQQSARPGTRHYRGGPHRHQGNVDAYDRACS